MRRPPAKSLRSVPSTGAGQTRASAPAATHRPAQVSAASMPARRPVLRLGGSLSATMVSASTPGRTGRVARLPASRQAQTGEELVYEVERVASALYTLHLHLVEVREEDAAATAHLLHGVLDRQAGGLREIMHQRIEAAG